MSTHIKSIKSWTILQIESKRDVRYFRLESGRNTGRSNDSKVDGNDCLKTVPFQSSERFNLQLLESSTFRAKKTISGYKLQIVLDVFKSQILNFPVFSGWTIMSHCPWKIIRLNWHVSWSLISCFEFSRWARSSIILTFSPPFPH